MSERAAWWVDHVLPNVATRQWVLTVPWSRRWLLARRPDLMCGVHRVAMRRIERWYAGQAGANGREAQTGSVTGVQRFGSALNLNLHFHIVSLDGVYTRGADGRLSSGPRAAGAARGRDGVGRAQAGMERRDDGPGVLSARAAPRG